MKEEELDRLLGIVVDVENLFMCVHKEEDNDTKQVIYLRMSTQTIKIHYRSTSTYSSCYDDAYYSCQNLRWRGPLALHPMKSQALPRASLTLFSSNSTTCPQKNGK